MNEDKNDDPSSNAPRDAVNMEVDSSPPADGVGKSVAATGVS
jgi:hypothetical protein